MNDIPVYNSKLKWCILAAGFTFLYLPILILIVYSFNENRLVTVWSGFSFKWYFELLEDDLLMGGVKLSLMIGFLSASAAVVLGTIAAFVLNRFGKFKGETGFAFMITHPWLCQRLLQVFLYYCYSLQWDKCLTSLASEA